MAQLKTYVCDVCGAQRKEANHWFLLDTTTKTMVITKWDDKLAETVDCHLCGEGCLYAKVSEVVGEWSGQKVISLQRLMAMEGEVCSTK